MSSEIRRDPALLLLLAPQALAEQPLVPLLLAVLVGVRQREWTETGSEVVKLRIARKMDQTPRHIAPNRRRDKRTWYLVYNDDQLRRAKKRLSRSWRTRSPIEIDGTRSVGPDFFAYNRVESRLIRQTTIAKMKRDRLAE